MKKWISTFCIVFFTIISMYAQQETLSNRAKVWGFWAGPLVELNTFDKNINNAYGGGGGLIIGQFFLGGYGLASADIEDLINEDSYQLDLAHGGLWLGYTHRPYKLFHPYTSVRVGWGGVDIDLEDFDTSYDHFDQVTVITPELGLEVNVTSFFHIAATAGYRFVDGISDNSAIGKNDLNGFNVGLNFRLGLFGNWYRANRNCN